MTTDNKLSFKTHIKNICQTAKCKGHALQHIRKYLSTDKAKALCSVFINNQFYYALYYAFYYCFIINNEFYNLDVFKEIANLKSTENPFSITTSGT